MNSQEAREILTLFRPGTADQNDPEFAVALKLTKQDANLAQWFQEHCQRHAALREKFRQIPVPEGLKEQILSERKVHEPGLKNWRSVRLSLAAAALVVLLSVLTFRLSTDKELDFALFENRMPRSVLRQYPKMDLETADLQRIHAFLVEKGYGNYELPGGLLKTRGTGCALRPWHGTTVPMICFSSGKASATNSPDLFLFMISRAAVADPPRNSLPQFKQLTSEMAIGTWTTGNNVYVLAGLGDENFLRRFF